MSYVWTPPPELVEQSNLTAFLRATRQTDYDMLASKADADPAWLTQEVSFATSYSIAPMKRCWSFHGDIPGQDAVSAAPKRSII
jgi:hypothetical protein